MFSGVQRDRVSPQAVQDLLELNRLGGYRGRAASPESVRSSRSPSPPASSSGRTSPAMSTISSMSRLKVSSSGIASGMRKLSSSPHLLGICEETEDGHEMADTEESVQLRTFDERIGRTNRSASTGVVHPHHSIQATKSSAASLLTTPFTVKSHTLPTSSQSTPNTYSSVRMIRPRQAIVSPDVCRRYDQHSRFLTRSKRSTSCSSSEASDDDDGRRLTMMSSKCASKFDERRRNDDDDDGDGGKTTTSRTTTTAATTSKSAMGGDSAKTSSSQSSQIGGSGDKRGSINDSMMSPSAAAALRPIPEMTLLDQSTDRKDRIFATCPTTQSLVRKWATNDEDFGRKAEKAHAEIGRWFGTPPREIQSPSSSENDEKPWLRSLRRALSSQELFKDHALNERCSIDSGCSSDEDNSPIIQNMYNDSKFSYLSTLPMEKVDKWLRCAEFVF
ncbi:unnamed protein product [Caenorhabditis bovis]|uniref:Uncharacterized protein n=1 Tax=Caenorhabditis bovis TaxID=2654633 RepID=A0A8S1F622_9PELO|nr:unnamed protein product [Caenorhabditis bovis]